MLKYEKYSQDYKARCLEAFDSNVPKFFAASERDFYLDFLEKHAYENYWCLLEGEDFIGAGGYYFPNPGVARLVWGIIDEKFHRQGYGSKLLNFRLKSIANDPTVKFIRLDTSQFNPEFFSRFGFRELSSTADYYAPGLHSHEMELIVDDAFRKANLDE